MTDLELVQADLYGGCTVSLPGADLRGADLRGADLRGAALYEANLTKAALWGADLTEADLRGANLTEADLTRAYLAGANLTRANLTGAYLYMADLTVADLTGADLPGADLTGARLYWADLTGADLTGADLTETHLGIWECGPDGIARRRVEACPGRDATGDTVNHPSHYRHGGFETIDVIEAWGLDFCLANTVKYISRAGKKAPHKEVEDLQKAAWYLARRIQQLEKTP